MKGQTTKKSSLNCPFQAAVYTAQMNAVKEGLAAGPERNIGNTNKIALC